MTGELPAPSDVLGNLLAVCAVDAIDPEAGFEESEVGSLNLVPPQERGRSIRSLHRSHPQGQRLIWGG